MKNQKVGYSSLIRLVIHLMPKKSRSSRIVWFNSMNDPPRVHNWTKCHKLNQDYENLKLQKKSFFVLFFAQNFSKKEFFSSKFLFIFWFLKSKHGATVNSQVKNFFYFFFWNFLSNDNKNVNLKYQNLEEDEHFYFIQS